MQVLLTDETSQEAAVKKKTKNSLDSLSRWSIFADIEIWSKAWCSQRLDLLAFRSRIEDIPCLPRLIRGYVRSRRLQEGSSREISSVPVRPRNACSD
jgi:hypothetical protein